MRVSFQLMSIRLEGTEDQKDVEAAYLLNISLSAPSFLSSHYDMLLEGVVPTCCSSIAS